MSDRYSRQTVLPGVGAEGQAHFASASALDVGAGGLGCPVLAFDGARLAFGGFSFNDWHEPAGVIACFIAPSAVTGADIVVDFRSVVEAPAIAFAGALRLTVATVSIVTEDGLSMGHGVPCCRSGLRAWRAAHLLAGHGLTDLALVALGG